MRTVRSEPSISICSKQTGIHSSLCVRIGLCTTCGIKQSIVSLQNKLEGFQCILVHVVTV